MSRKPGPLATSTQLSPLAEQLFIQAQIELDDLASQKRASGSGPPTTSCKKSKTITKQPKVRTIPKASTTISSQILDKYRKKRSSTKSKEVSVPKAKVISGPSSNDQNIPTASAGIQSTSLGTKQLNLTEEELIDLQKKITSGEIDLRSYFNVLRPNINATVPESEDLESDIPESEVTPQSAILESDADIFGEEDDDDSTQDGLIAETEFESQSLLRPTPASQLTQLQHENQLGQLQDDDSELEGESSEASKKNGSESSKYVSNSIEGNQTSSNEIQTSGKDKTPTGSQVIVIDGKIDVAGAEVDLSELHNIVHSQNCCSPCRQMLILILEKLNQLLLSSQSRAPIPLMKKPNPQDFKLLPSLPCKTHDDLKNFTMLLEVNKNAVSEYMNYLALLGGDDHTKAIRNMLAGTITNELADKCTWKIPKLDKDGNPKLVVGKFHVFEVISVVTITLWKGYTVPSNPQAGVSVTRDGNFVTIKDWIKRSSRRVAEALNTSNTTSI